MSKDIKDEKKIAEINARLKQVRLTKKLSQEEFGKRIGRSQNQISSIETGVRNVSPHVVKDLKIEFNVNTEWMNTGKGEMFNPTQMKYGSNDPEIIKLTELFAQLNEESRSRFYAQLKKELESASNHQSETTSQDNMQ